MKIRNLILAIFLSFSFYNELPFVVLCPFRVSSVQIHSTFHNNRSLPRMRDIAGLLGLSVGRFLTDPPQYINTKLALTFLKASAVLRDWLFRRLQSSNSNRYISSSCSSYTRGKEVILSGNNKEMLSFTGLKVVNVKC